MKLLKFCVLFPIIVCVFTVHTILEWMVELYDLPFAVWDDLP